MGTGANAGRRTQARLAWAAATGIDGTRAGAREVGRADASAGARPASGKALARQRQQKHQRGEATTDGVACERVWHHGHAREGGRAQLWGAVVGYGDRGKEREAEAGASLALKGSGGGEARGRPLRRRTGTVWWWQRGRGRGGRGGGRRGR